MKWPLKLVFATVAIVAVDTSSPVTAGQLKPYAATDRSVVQPLEMQFRRGARPAMRPAGRPAFGGRPGFGGGRPAFGRPGVNRPAFNRPGVGRPPRPGFIPPAAGGRPPIVAVRPDGSSIVVRPPGGRPPPGVRPPPIIRPPGNRPPPGFRPGWRPWRPGLGFALVTGALSVAAAQQLGWCHVHRWPERNMRFHDEVECHRHRQWNHPSIRYVYGE